MIKAIANFTMLVTASAATLMLFAAPVAAQNQGLDAAARFGAREEVEDISLSPDARSVAMVMSDKGHGNALYTVAVGSKEVPKRILVATGDPERLRGCGWVSNDRLLCNVVIVRKDLGVPSVMSRMIAVDAAGGNLKVVSTKQGAYALAVAYFGGTVIDWLPGADGTVLVGRTYVPEGG